jgi:hypothetical protein
MRILDCILAQPLIQSGNGPHVTPRGARGRKEDSRRKRIGQIVWAHNRERRSATGRQTRPFLAGVRMDDTGRIEVYRPAELDPIRPLHNQLGSGRKR